MPKAGGAQSGGLRPTRVFAHNCGPCKKRKRRCDRAKPCSNCVLHSCETDCYSQEVQIAESTCTPPLHEIDSQKPKRSLSPSRRQTQQYSYSQPQIPSLLTSERTTSTSTSSYPAEKAHTGFASASSMLVSLPAPAVCLLFLDFASAVSRPCPSTTGMS
jgi:hypothetical protein